MGFGVMMGPGIMIMVIPIYTYLWLYLYLDSMAVIICNEVRDISIG
ncbi:hypothetical protein [Intestinibacter bartlettii]|uniref:Uncharacterized protein n=1 Tax=Intestinibacter bartlettii TaxID=261299 RepID=A0ABS6DUJ7_9FIRM|nr:hypothetical protein [Intestinibacter bartlettii]MBU5335486.1 hypothetical protein [Intestinibacter bartlettii]MDO5010344.1 hypothetical protein [Intestinibacter bartlettii]